jgi:colanic acid/amylovoran biosynthesis glycosyltransferase
MRVAYLINQYPKVSHSFIRREIRALERQGVDVTRIALRGWDGDLADPEDRIERERTRYALHGRSATLLLSLLRMAVTRPARLARGIGTAWRMSRGADRPFPVHLAYLAEACRIVPWLDSADVAHLHAHFGTNSAEVAMQVGILGGLPWSFTVHGPEEFDKAPLIGLAEKVRRATFVAAVSSFGRSQLYRLVDREHWPKIKVVHCGIDADFRDVPAAPIADVPRLVCVGRLCEQKGQILLLDAARRLAEDGVDFELVLAGDGELRGVIESLIAAYGLGDRVRITGWISGLQVRDEILAARAMVLPSFAEGLPVAIMEAMALRRPVISTYIAGIPELVRDGETGWLVPAGDVEALVEAMRTCLETKPEELMRLGEIGQRRIAERHDADTESGKLAQLLY